MAATALRRGGVSEVAIRAARLFQTDLDRRLAQHGISHSQCAALAELWNAAPGGVIQGDLCRALEMERSSMSTLLDSLERNRLVVRKEDPTDGRRWLVHLTPRGRALEQPVTQTLGEWEAELRRALGGDTYDALQRALQGSLEAARTQRQAREA